MDYDTLLELAKKRRSIRRYKPDPIPDDYPEKIIEVARWAPSGFNSQPWEFVVVKDKEIKDKVVQLLSEEGRPPREKNDYGDAPVFIILFGDPRTKAGLPDRLAANEEMNQPVFNAGLANAFLYMHMAATSLGLASQWMSRAGFPNIAPKLKELLGVPKGFQIFDMMVVGYPAIEARPKPLREDDKMIHYDVSKEEDFRTDKEVAAFVKRTKGWMMGTIKRDPDK